MGFTQAEREEINRLCAEHAAQEGTVIVIDEEVIRRLLSEAADGFEKEEVS